MSNNDLHILKGNAIQVLDLNDLSLDLKELCINKCIILLNYLLQILPPDKLQTLSKVNNFNDFTNFVITNLEIETVDNVVFLKEDIVNFYYKLFCEQEQIEFKPFIPLNLFECLYSIFKINNLFELLGLCLKSNSQFERETFSSLYQILEIINLNIIPDLTVFNYSDILTFSQRNLLMDLVEQKNKKFIQNIHTGVLVAVAEALGGKGLNINDILFPLKTDASINSNLESKRDLLLNKFKTGNKLEDDKLILNALQKNKDLKASDFFNQDDLSLYGLI